MTQVKTYENKNGITFDEIIDEIYKTIIWYETDTLGKIENIVPNQIENLWRYGIDYKNLKRTELKKIIENENRKIKNTTI